MPISRFPTRWSPRWAGSVVLVSRTRCSARALLRRAGTHVAEHYCVDRWAPAQRRTTSRCAASGASRMSGDFRSLYVSFTRLWRYHYAMTSPPIRQPVRIIGIDPGLRRTGWGVIETEGNRLVFIGCGSVEPPDDLPLASRLLAIHEGLAAVLGDFRPAEAAVEQTFVNKDGVATLKLGQARGVAMLAPAMFGISVAEYAPNQVKKTVVGAGHADKNQIAVMLKILLPKAEPKSADAADALAIAITHAHHRGSAALRLRVAAYDRQAQGPDRLLRRGLRDPRRRRRRLSGALLVAHAAGAAVARRGRGAVDRDLCARGPDQAVRLPHRYRARMVSPAADRAGRRRQGRARRARRRCRRPNWRTPSRCATRPRCRARRASGRRSPSASSPN